MRLLSIISALCALTSAATLAPEVSFNLFLTEDNPFMNLD